MERKLRIPKIVVEDDDSSNSSSDDDYGSSYGTGYRYYGYSHNGGGGGGGYNMMYRSDEDMDGNGKGNNIRYWDLLSDTEDGNVRKSRRLRRKSRNKNKKTILPPRVNHDAWNVTDSCTRTGTDHHSNSNDNTHSINANEYEDDTTITTTTGSSKKKRGRPRKNPPGTSTSTNNTPRKRSKSKSKGTSKSKKIKVKSGSEAMKKRSKATTSSSSSCSTRTNDLDAEELRAVIQHIPIQNPVPTNDLVDLKEDAKITASLDMLIMAQLDRVEYEVEKDPLNYLRQKPLPEGYPGVKCIHCDGISHIAQNQHQHNDKRWFFNSQKQLSSGFPKIEFHLLEQCPACPDDVKKYIRQGKKQEYAERSLLRLESDSGERLRYTRMRYAGAVFERLDAPDV